jgi:hypothetical protein
MVKAALAAPTLSVAPALGVKEVVPERVTLMIARATPPPKVHVIAAFAVKVPALSTTITSPFAAIANAPATVCLASAHVVPLSVFAPSTAETKIVAIL